MSEEPKPAAAPTGIVYPPPPLVHWSALLIAAIVAESLLDRLLPDALSGFALTLVLNIWAVYLCLWIRRLDPDSKSLLWLIASIITELASDFIGMRQNPTRLVNWVEAGLAIASAVLSIVVLFVIRAELERHYNEREPIGLHLGPVMTFFFAYLYFQYHLYDIAKFKQRQAEGSVANAGGTLLP